MDGVPILMNSKSKIFIFLLALSLLSLVGVQSVLCVLLSWLGAQGRLADSLMQVHCRPGPLPNYTLTDPSAGKGEPMGGKPQPFYRSCEFEGGEL